MTDQQKRPDHEPYSDQLTPDPRQSSVHTLAWSLIHIRPGTYEAGIQSSGFVLGSPMARSPSFHLPRERMRSIRSKRFSTFRLVLILLADLRLACCVIFSPDLIEIAMNSSSRSLRSSVQLFIPSSTLYTLPEPEIKSKRFSVRPAHSKRYITRFAELRA